MVLFAQGILDLYWDQSVPVNLARIAKHMGAAIALSDTLEQCARIDITPDNKARITIGSRQPMVRQRYGVAHALGHRSLHHLRPGAQRLIDVSDNFGVDHNNRIDSEANAFALALLMPTSAVQRCLHDEGLSYLPAWAERFEVAPILVKQRLADLGLRLPLPKPQRQALPWVERLA